MQHILQAENSLRSFLKTICLHISWILRPGCDPLRQNESYFSAKQSMRDLVKINRESVEQTTTWTLSVVFKKRRVFSATKMKF